MKKIVTIVLMAVLMMMGCGHTTPVVIDPVVQTKLVYVGIPTSMTAVETIPLPPSAEAYVRSNVAEREDLLTRYVISLLNAIGNANSKLLAIADLNKQQKAVVEKGNSHD